ncbi:MAG: nucleotidyltransferase domain-containing protein, partial [Pseudomonadota bacterium]
MSAASAFSRGQKQEILAYGSACQGDARAWRDGMLEIIAPHYKQKHAAILASIQAGTSTQLSSESLAKLVTQVIQLLANAAQLYCKRHQKSHPIGIVALGGFGRGVLAPYSDIDITIITNNQHSKFVQSFVELLIPCLWDLGLKVGQSLFTHKSWAVLAGEDHRVLTSFLTRRWLWGDRSLQPKIEKVFQTQILKNISESQFFQTKLLEYETRHEKMGNSLYLLEPNLKEGCGGLRDLHFIAWIAAYMYRATSVTEMVQCGLLDEGQARQYRRAQAHLTKLRVWLH